jgi:hypothetical protein
MRTNRILWLACLVVAVTLAPGCQKKAEAPPPTPAPTGPGPFRVASFELGKALTADKKVAAPMTSFGTRDTIYVAIASEGAADSTTLSARWTFQASPTESLLVAQDDQRLAPTGPAQTEFHIMKPTAWPKGPYTVEIAVDGKSAGRKSFDIK